MQNVLLKRWRRATSSGLVLSLSMLTLGAVQANAQNQLREGFDKRFPVAAAAIPAAAKQLGTDLSRPYSWEQPRPAETTETPGLEGGTVKPCFDFFGTGRTSFATVRGEGSGIIWTLSSNPTGTFQTVNYGLAGLDSVTPGYFDGDNRADLNVWRRGATGTAPATYFLRPSTSPTSIIPIQWGLSSDTPGREADYDGDGRDDPTVVRETTSNLQWYFLRSSNATFGAITFGAPDDYPLAGADYNGDGRADISVARRANGALTYYVADSNSGALLLAKQWGNDLSDIVVIGDYLGDARADFAVWRSQGTDDSGVWYISENGGNGFIRVNFGTGGVFFGDAPLCGDYNGDGKDDLAVYTPFSGEFKWLNSPDYSTSGIQRLGEINEFPVAALKTF